MFNQWLGRHSYSAVSSSEDSEAALKTPTLFNWSLPRRVRNACILAVIVGLFLISYHFSLPRRLEKFVPVESYNGSTIAAPPPPSLSQNCTAIEQDKDTSESAVRWSDYAYVQYVTNGNYLCNSLMIFESLRRANTKADLLMLYPQQWNVPDDDGSNAGFESKLLAHARDQYKAKLVPIQVKTFENKKDPTWQDSYTKLLAFNQTQYKRVISLDSDGTVLQHMDELFLLPSTPVAMPRAYWGEPNVLSSQVIVIEPSESEWKRVEEAIEHHEGHDYDMDILNKLYKLEAMIIPHRKYDLLTGEFRSDKHENYLGRSGGKWDARKIYKEAKFVHFSDWPMPKPWLKVKPEDDINVDEIVPKCKKVGETEDCSERDIWVGIRKDFEERRKKICGHTYDNVDEKRRSVLLRRSKYEPVFG